MKNTYKATTTNLDWFGINKSEILRKNWVTGRYETRRGTSIGKEAVRQIIEQHPDWLI